MSQVSYTCVYSPSFTYLDKMGRRKGRKNNKGKQSFAAHTIVSGKVFIQTSATTSAAAVALHPSVIARLVDLANAFQLYRFTSLKVEVLPSWRGTSVIPGTGELYGVGYYNDTVDTLPNTTQAISELAYSVVRPMGYVFDTANSSAISVMSVPSAFKVPRKFLIGDSPLKWFKANLGTPDSWDELQGNVIYRGESSIQVFMMWTYTCEFAGPLPFVSTPKDLEERVKRILLNKRLLSLYEEWRAGKIKVPEGAPRTYMTLVEAKGLDVSLGITHS